MLNYCIKRKSSIFIPIQHRIYHKAADGLAAFGCKLPDLSRLILGAGQHYASGLVVNPLANASLWPACTITFAAPFSHNRTSNSKFTVASKAFKTIKASMIFWNPVIVKSPLRKPPQRGSFKSILVMHQDCGCLNCDSIQGNQEHHFFIRSQHRFALAFSSSSF